MRPTGYFQDTIDTRDLSFGAPPSKLKLPSKSSLLASSFDVLPPEQTAESCVGYAVSAAFVSLFKFRNQGTHLMLRDWPSPRFIWWISRATHHAIRLNTGTFLRTAIKQVAALGMCNEEMCPTFDGADLANYDVRPSPLAFHSAYDNRTSVRYQRIGEHGNARIEAWKSALHGNLPIVFGIPIGLAFMKWRGGELLKPPADDAVLGGHALCALGYNEEGVFGPATYGVEWGRDGWFHLSWDYVTKCAQDQWVIDTRSEP